MSRTILIFLPVLITVLVVPGDALAWGVVTHLALAERITDSLTLAGTCRNALTIISNQAAFLVGSVLPDVFAVRNWFFKPRHWVHGWCLTGRLLASAESDEEMSLALGYAVHLSSDVICHNFLIPRYIFLQDRNPKVAHILAESVVDGYVGRAELIKETEPLLGAEGRLKDFFLKCSGIGVREFEANVAVLRSAMRLKRRTAIDSFAYRLKGDEDLMEMVDKHLDLSVDISVKSLRDLLHSLPVKYCTEGERRIRLSRIRRRLSERHLSSEEFRKGLSDGRFEYIHSVPPGLAGA